MPAKSQAQFRFFKWAEGHPGASGVSHKVAQEFTGGFHGRPGSVKALPEKVKKQAGGDVPEERAQPTNAVPQGPQEQPPAWQRTLWNILRNDRPPSGAPQMIGVRGADGGGVSEQAKTPPNFQQRFEPPATFDQRFQATYDDQQADSQFNKTMQLPEHRQHLKPGESGYQMGGAPPGMLGAPPQQKPIPPQRSIANAAGAATQGPGMQGGGLAGMAGQATPWYARAEARNLVHSGLLNTSGPGRTDNLPIGVRGGSYVIPADVVSGLGQGNSKAGANVLNTILKSGPYGTGGAGQLGGRGPYGSSGKGPYGIASTPLKGGKSTFGGKMIPMMKPQAGPQLGTASTSTGMGTSTSGMNRQPKLMQATGGRVYKYTSGGAIMMNDGGAVPISYAHGGRHPTAPGHVPIVAAGGEYIVHPDDVGNIGGGDVDRGHSILDHFVKTARKHNIKTLQKLPGPKTK